MNTVLTPEPSIFPLNKTTSLQLPAPRCTFHLCLTPVPHLPLGPGQTKKVKTSQSTVFIPSQFPDKPMDGSSQSGNCVQTLQEDDPWWMADLGSTQIVNSISITNRKDCCQEQINGVIILVGDSADLNGKMNARCAVINSLSQGKTEFFKCETMQGRYVSVVNPKRRTFLSFCEVRVFGKASDSISSSIATSSPESQPFLPKAYDQESRELPGEYQGH
uniref:Fucolectin tachylectin-4 pentraxin-1 domain-containing protein n=1 Tax=Monodelphis domestica TaxID=13616 RepID=A0A5F8H1H5_MONDO